MKLLNSYITEYTKQMKKGDIPKAYRGLMGCMMDLRTHFINKYPQFTVSGLYPGYMDMTYFAVTPQSLKDKKLKIAVVLVHSAMRFEVWLAATNKQIQKQYRQILKDNPRNTYTVSPDDKGVDSIVWAVLADNPDFDHPDALTDKIENGVLEFTKNIQNILATE